MPEKEETETVNHDYDCLECKKPVLFKSDHKMGCSYGPKKVTVPVIIVETY